MLQQWQVCRVYDDLHSVQNGVYTATSILNVCNYSNIYPSESVGVQACCLYLVTTRRGPDCRGGQCNHKFKILSTLKLVKLQGLF